MYTIWKENVQKLLDLIKRESWKRTVDLVNVIWSKSFSAKNGYFLESPYSATVLATKTKADFEILKLKNFENYDQKLIRYLLINDNLIEIGGDNIIEECRIKQ
jgi:hypothetical protein